MACQTRKTVRQPFGDPPAANHIHGRHQSLERGRWRGRMEAIRLALLLPLRHRRVFLGQLAVGRAQARSNVDIQSFHRLFATDPLLRPRHADGDFGELTSRSDWLSALEGSHGPPMQSGHLLRCSKV
jgi:hypothetical protein